MLCEKEYALSREDGFGDEELAMGLEGWELGAEVSGSHTAIVSSIGHDDHYVSLLT